MKLVTDNIQYSKGKDERYDLGRIADALGADHQAVRQDIDL